MSGELWRMAQAGITLLPSEAQKLAADYESLRQEVFALRARCAALEVQLSTTPRHEPDESRR